jgi:uncharacterized protein with PQ loop repeat
MKESLVANNQEHSFKFLTEIEHAGAIFFYNFIIITLIILMTLSIIFSFDNVIYVESLGTISSFLESLLVLPQIVAIYKVKSTKNLSYILVLCWFLGDSMKTYYFYISSAPIQMLLSGFWQLILNFVVLFQIIKYRNNK